MISLTDDPTMDFLLQQGGGLAVVVFLVVKFLGHLKTERAACQTHVEKVAEAFERTIKEIHDRQHERDAALMKMMAGEEE
jgi:large-conductance mechanosensitive channel